MENPQVSLEINQYGDWPWYPEKETGKSVLGISNKTYYTNILLIFFNKNIK